MGSDITLFSGYSQKENRTTNYCLLVLRMLYEENPKFLGEIFSDLIDEELGDLVGVQFRQQQKKKSSIPDGLIVQRPFAVYIETKSFDWFYDEQLVKHLDALDADGAGTKVLIALGNFEVQDEKRFERVETVCAEKYGGRLFFAALGFDDFLRALRERRVSKNLSDTLDDFAGYLDEAGLLPQWKHRLDVVNCGRSHGEVVNERVYLCPAKGGSYNHARALFFGMYRWKAVRQIALIEAVVDLAGDGAGKLRWKHVETPDNQLISIAEDKRVHLRPGSEPVRVFLLGPLHATDFRKPTKGGMQTSKRYFDVERVSASDAADLAAKLKGKDWASF